MTTTQILRRFIFIILIFVSTHPLYAQTIAKYKFKSYPSEKVYSGQKAKLNLKSNKLGKSFPTALKEGYKDRKINFGGHYIIIIWGCGMGCLDGAMVDAQTGIIYDLPLGEEKTVHTYCQNDEGNVQYEPNSNLLITTACLGEQKTETKQGVDHLTFFINIWNDQKKKFSPTKFVNKNIVQPQSN